MIGFMLNKRKIKSKLYPNYLYQTCILTGIKSNFLKSVKTSYFKKKKTRLKSIIEENYFKNQIINCRILKSAVKTITKTAYFQKSVQKLKAKPKTI